MIPVTKIRLMKFATYGDQEIELSPEGLNLIVGQNGTGKSSLIEALCWVLYGKQQRGRPPQVGALVEATFRGGYYIRRVRLKDGIDLMFKVDEGGKKPRNLAGQTNTETQQRIDEVFGPWERFAPTRLFARDFMAKFAAATDKERKALIEEILGLGQFDIAHMRARDAATKIRGSLDKLESHLQAHKGTIDRQVALLSDLGDPDELPNNQARLVALQADLDVATKAKALATMDLFEGRKLMHDLVMEREKATYARQEAMKRLAEIAAKRSRVGQYKDCPICLRSVPTETHADISAHYAKEAQPHEATRLEATETIASLDSQVAEVQAETSHLQARDEAAAQEQANHAQAVAALKATIAALMKQEGIRAKAQADHTALVDRAEKLEAELATTRYQAAVARIGCGVLDYRGARVLLMSRALQGLTAKANEVLQALGMGMTVVMSSMTKQKSGKEVDEINVSLTGAGGGDYQSASAGERARVDVGLMLGLAAIQGGADSGPLAFDEVFDTLDDDGIERVAAYIADLAETHQVFVVTHHPELKALFPRGRVFKATRDEKGLSQLTEG